MPADRHSAAQFRAEIATLIAEIENCMNATPAIPDRETALQREAFRERRDQATYLSCRLAEMHRTEWPLRSGDAHRIRNSLQLSLAYFRSRQSG